MIPSPYAAGRQPKRGDMRKKSKTQTSPFRADLPLPEAAFVESVKAELGVNSNAKLLTEAAAIVKWVLKERRSGRRIVSFEEGTPMRELASAAVECATFAQAPPYAELQWTPKQLQRIQEVLSHNPEEPSPDLLKALSGS